MNKIITAEQAESIANYILNSSVPSKDAQTIATVLRTLPAMSPSVPTKVEPQPEKKPE